MRLRRVGRVEHTGSELMQNRVTCHASVGGRGSRRAWIVCRQGSAGASPSPYERSGHLVDGCRRPLSPTPGFTLVELLVATLVMVVALIGVYALFQQVMAAEGGATALRDRY